MLPTASKDVFINFSDQCIHIVNNKAGLNRIKGNKKMQGRESLFKYKLTVYNVQMNSDVNHTIVRI